MAYQTIRIKNTNVAGKTPVPNDIDVAELCVNLKDHTLFSKDADGNIFELVGGGIGVGPTPPVLDNETGDLWWDGNVLLVWNGSDWEQVAPVTSVNGETGDVILALDDLSDVTTLGANEGDILILQGGTWVPASPASVSADVDLGYTAAPTGGIVTNTAGDDSNLPLVDDTNAGLMPPDAFTKLDNLPETIAAPNDGKLTLVESDGSVLGSFTADQAGDDTITLPAGFSGDYDDLTNKPTLPAAPNDGTLTIKNNDGSANTTFSADQAGPSELILPKGFSGSYNDLTDKPAAPSGGVTQIVAGTNVTIDPAGGTGVVTINSSGGSSGGLTGAESPLTVNGSNVKLEYARGLHVVGNKLETHIDSTLKYNGNEMGVNFPEHAVVSYECQAKNTNNASVALFTGGGYEDLPGKTSIEFDLDEEVDGFVTIIVFKLTLKPNPNENYGTDSTQVCRVAADCHAEVSGRNVYCRTSGDRTNVALNMANTIGWPGGPPGSGENWINRWYSTRIDEWTCNTGTDRVKFEFGVRNCNHNKIWLEYNSGCRVSIFPYDKR